MSDNGIRPVDEHGEEVTAANPTVVPQMDLGELLETAISKAVAAQINAQAKQIAEGVVANMLTPEVVAGMRETAILETELALNPAPEPVQEPEPAPQTADEAEAEAEPEQQARRLRYATVAEFVERYVVQLYRREVSARGSERTLRWCPRWWDHGEVLARFEAMWVAFEHLRQGAETEPSVWWLHHFDPHMDRILDPEGPFKYCSVAEGHRPKLPKLPVTPARPELCPDGHYDWHTTASGLVVPPATAGQRRVVMEFPG